MMHQSQRGYTGKVGPSLTIKPLSRNTRYVTHLFLSLMQCSLCFHFQKLKHGIPLFPKVSHSVGKVARHTDFLSDRVLGALLDAGIIFISPKNSAFVSSFFLAYLSIKLSKEINDITNMIEQ